MSTKTLDQIRDDEILSLDQLIDLYGRSWKNELRQAWETGHYSKSIDDTPALQRLRNRMGPSVLSAITTEQVHTTALEIARNVFALSTKPIPAVAREASVGPLVSKPISESEKALIKEQNRAAVRTEMNRIIASFGHEHPELAALALKAAERAS